MKRALSLVGVLGVLAVLVAAIAAAAPASGPPGLAQAIAAKDRHAGELFAHPGVVGAGVGLDNGQAVVVVLTAAHGVAGIPGRVDGVKVAVRVTGSIGALDATATQPIRATGAAATPEATGARTQSPTSYFTRPVPIGVSTGRRDECAAGTIGARVKRGSTVYALSNNHVYAKENDASVGDQIVQPGLYDSKPKCTYSTKYNLATLSDWVNIDFSENASNTVDAAIARTTTGALGNSTPSDGYGTPSSTTKTAVLDMAVQKYGRTTRDTHGIVCVTDLDVNISYSSGLAHFVNQIGVCNSGGRFNGAGDSGSLIVTDNSSKNPVGLLFAGGGNVTIANPIGYVLSALGISIDGS